MRSDQNPYPENEPRLRQAWEDGFNARKAGRKSTETHENLDEVGRAWLKGYETAKLKGLGQQA